MEPIEVGDIIVATAGRETGKYFVVLKIEDNMLDLIDGQARKVARPKRKNIKHVKKLNVENNVFTSKFKTGEKVLDSEVRKFIKILEGEDLYV